MGGKSLKILILICFFGFSFASFSFEKVFFSNDSDFISIKDSFSGNKYDLVDGITIEVKEKSIFFSDICYENGLFYILDSYNRYVYLIDEKGLLKKRFKTDDKGEAKSINVKNGLIYIVIGNKIEIYDEAGNLIYSAGGDRGTNKGEFFLPTFLAIDPERYLYICDSGNERIQILDSSRKPVFILNSSNGHFINPTGIDYSDNGYIAITDNYLDMVLLYDKYMEFIKSFGETGDSPGEFQYPTKVKIDPYSNIFVFDRFNMRIQKFNVDKGFLAMVGSKNKRYMLNSSSFTIDKYGNICIVDNRLKKIWRFGTRYFERGKKFYKNGNYDQAIRLLKLALLQRGNNQNAAFYLAYCYYMKKMYKMSYNSLGVAYKIDKSSKCGEYAYQERMELEKWFRVGRHHE